MEAYGTHRTHGTHETHGPAVQPCYVEDDEDGAHDELILDIGPAASISGIERQARRKRVPENGSDISRKSCLLTGRLPSVPKYAWKQAVRSRALTIERMKEGAVRSIAPKKAEGTGSARIAENDRQQG